MESSQLPQINPVWGTHCLWAFEHSKCFRLNLNEWLFSWGLRSGSDSAVHLSPDRACSEGLTLCSGRMDVVSEQWSGGGRKMNSSECRWPKVQNMWTTQIQRSWCQCSCPAFLKTKQSEVSWLVQLVYAPLAQGSSPTPCFYLCVGLHFW